MTYTFSVIIPFYNAEKYLKVSINSILIQKRKDTEIILINDCSTDNSGQICDSLKKKYSFIKVLKHEKNQGVGISRNNAIHIARGKYLVFLDSDDSLSLKSLSSLKKVIKEKFYPDVVVVQHKKSTYPNSNYELIKDIDYPHKKPEKFIGYLNKTKKPFSDCWFFSVRRDFIINNKILFPNTRFGESEYFVAKALCLMKNYACCNQYFYFKNDREKSLNSSDDYFATISVLKNLIELSNFLSKKSLNLIKQRFIMRYMEDGFGVFSALLILRNSENLNNLSKFLEKNKKKIRNFNKLKKKYELFLLVNKYGSKKGLLNYKENIIKKKIKIIGKLITNYKNIYIYCKSKYAAATINILKKNKCNIKGIIDDSKIFGKNNFLNYRTINSKKFLKKSIKKISEFGIIINHQRANVSKKIYHLLISRGFKKRQIAIIKY